MRRIIVRTALTCTVPGEVASCEYIQLCNIGITLLLSQYFESTSALRITVPGNHSAIFVKRLAGREVREKCFI